MQTILLDEDGLLLEPCFSCPYSGVDSHGKDYQCSQQACQNPREYQFAVDDLLGLNDYEEE